MANPNKFTTKEVLNKVLLDSSGNAVTANSVTAQEALNTVLDTTNNRLNMSLAGGTITGDVTISGDLTVSGGGSLTFDETVTGNMTLTKDVDSEFVALVLTNQSDANSTAGSVSQRFDLEDTSGNAVDSAKILVSKEAAFTSTASTQDSNMAFFTSENGTLSEAVRIASSRSLSINNSQFYIWSDDYFGTNYELLRIDKPSGSNARISVYSANDGVNRGLDFELGGATRVSIDTAGKFGIGVTPSYALDVKTNLEGNVARFWNDGNDGNRDVLLLQGGADSAVFTTRFITFLDGDGGTVGCLQGANGTSNGGLALNITPDTNDLVVDSNGNVGIGATPNASYLLHTNGGNVRSEASSFVLNLYDSQAYSAGVSGARVRLQGKDSAGNEKNLVDLIGTSRGANQGEFQVKVRNSSGNYTEYLRIEDDGATTIGVHDAQANSFGIGSNPTIEAHTTKLDIGNSNTAVSQIRLKDNDATDGFYIESNSTFKIGYNTTPYHTMTQNGIAEWTSNTNSNLSIDTASATSEPRIIAINDDETAYVTLGLYAQPLELKRGQIKFPATQVASADANTLDDYEEGTWSPVICQADDVSDVLPMHSETAGNYTKIGNIVHITGQAIGNSSDGDMLAADSIAIKGLPFTVPNAQKNRSAATLVSLTVNLASGKRIAGYVIQNSSQINLYVNDGTSEGTLRFDEFTNAGHVIFQATYLV